MCIRDRRYRCPKEGKHYGWGGDLPSEDARGIGIYINGATASCEVDNSREYWQNAIEKSHNNFIDEIGQSRNLHDLQLKKKDDEMDKVLLENLKLREELMMLKAKVWREKAIENLESACGDYKDENSEDDVYETMCELVGTLH